MEGTSTAELTALTDLLRLADQEQEERTPGYGDGSRITPATVGAPVKDDGVKPPEPKAARDPKAIWSDEEVTNAVDDDDDDDPRERPEYEFLYKQAISTADNYLGMAYVHKDPGSLSCEDLVVRIELPGTAEVGELTLDVQPTAVKLHSPRYRLGLYLPHRVDAERGKAAFDAKLQRLTLTLPILRDDPFAQP